jgi:hypothetical protein
MKAVRITTELINVTPIDGRGHRSNQTLLYLSERDQFLREAARLHCVGMSDRRAADFIHKKLTRYAQGAWRRDQAEALPPPQYAGRVEHWLWCVLKCHDRPVSEELIRKVLARSS